MFDNETKARCRELFIKLYIIYLIAYSSIIRADFNYCDDLGRKASGYHGWLDWSRWTTTFLSNVIHADVFLADISPLPQLLAAGVIALAGVIIWESIYSKKAVAINVLALALIGLCPYFMGCIIYKYDSLYMGIAVLASVIPFIFYGKNKRAFILVSVVSILIMLTSYQAANGIYPMMVVFITMNKLADKAGRDERKQIFIWVGLSVASYLFTTLFFRLFLMLPNGNPSFSISSFIPGVLSKYYAYYSYMWTDLKLFWIFLLFLLAVLYIVGLVYRAVIRGNNVVTTCILSIVCLVINSFFSFGAYLMLVEDNYDLRTYLGFCIFVSLVAVEVSNTIKLNSNRKLFDRISDMVRIFCVAAIFWCFFTNTFVVGNAVAEQKRYTDYRVNMVVDDLNELNILSPDHETEVQIIGGLECSPVIMNMSQNYDLLIRLIPTEFGEGTWGYYYLMNYFNLPNAKYHVEQDYTVNTFPLLKDTSFHAIYGDRDHIVIVIKDIS